MDIPERYRTTFSGVNTVLLSVGRLLLELSVQKKDEIPKHEKYFTHCILNK